MSVAALSDTSRTVLATLHELQQASSRQLAEALELPIEDVYASLVQLHDHGHADMRNVSHEYRRGFGRACIWSPT